MDTGEPTTDPEPAEPALREQLRSRRGRVLGRIAFLAVTAISLYVLWPSLLKVFSAWPELITINPSWFAVVLACELVSFGCIWILMRLAMRTKEWFVIATAQVAGNAFSRIVPGGAAAGGALQFRMLVHAGFGATRVGTALTAASLISTATVFALPLLTLPTILLGSPVPAGLSQAAWLGAAAFVVFFALGAALLATDGALELLGRTLQRAMKRLRPGQDPTTDLPGRLLRERDEIRRTLDADWWKALLSASGNWAFDYLALLAALTAVGSRPRPSLVLLAYVAAVVLGMIPITPGGLGFVEAGLTATLVLAGVSAADAVLATLAYRLVSYWLPILSGPVAYWLFSRRHGRAPSEPAVGS